MHAFVFAGFECVEIHSAGELSAQVIPTIEDQFVEARTAVILPELP